MVFVMLRDLIGEAAFDRAIKLFWEQKNRFRIAGWKELQLAFEQASGRVLADFFRQWLDVPGGPKVALEQAYFVAQGNGGGVLHVELSQSGLTHTLHLPLQMEDGSGSRTRWRKVVSKARETIWPTPELPQTSEPGPRRDSDLQFSTWWTYPRRQQTGGIGSRCGSCWQGSRSACPLY